MAGEEKPYRVYRGRRVRGRVPLLPRQAREAKPDGDGRGTGYPGPGAMPKPKRRRYGRWIALGVLGLLLLVVAWLLASYFSFRSGVGTANGRLPAAARAALTRQGGFLLSKPTDILVLGIDHAPSHGRAAENHSDSILLVRTDPGRHRIAYLSIPRDLRVGIPGHGQDKINAAFQIGGPTLAVKTVESVTGLPVNHLAIVDFSQFESLIDKLGGVTVDVPRPILSNRFDCPLASEARCRQWPGWRFAKGPQRMDGHRALIYSRIRENQLDRGETDIARGARQQQVLQAVLSKLASVGTLTRLPFVGGDLLSPVATDLSAWQLLQLGWVKFRAPGARALHCRLGGSASSIGGGSYIIGTEENVAVIHMLTGQSAPQPPLPGSGPFGPGCAVGSKGLLR